MKRKISCLLLAVLAAGLMLSFTGCIGGEGGEKETLIVMHYRVEDSAFYEWMVEEFEKEYNCKVQYDGVPTGDWGSVSEGRLSADAVDVFGVYPGSVYRDDKTLPYMMDLSDMDFVTRLTDEYVDYATYTDGKVYCAPLNMVSNTVFYNKAIFEEYGLSEPSDYAGFIAVCETLKAHSADFGNAGNLIDGAELKAPIVFGGRETWPITMTYNAIEAAVVRAVDPDFYVDVYYNKTKSMDDDLIRETFAKYKEISSYYQFNSYGVSYTRLPGLFARGEYGMMIDGSWSYSQILKANADIEVGCFPLPANDSADYSDVTVGKPGSGFAIHKNTQHEELARAFIEFHYREDVYARFLSEVMMGSVLKDMPTPAEDPVINELYNESYRYVSPLSEYIISCMSYPHSICEKLAIGNYDADAAVAAWMADYNRTLGQAEALMERWMALYNKNYQSQEP